MKVRENRRTSSSKLGKYKIGQDVELDEAQIQDGIRAQRVWTWFDGKDPSQMPDLEVINIDDPDLGDIKLVACGRLVRLHVRAPRKNPTHPRRQRDTMLELSRRASSKSYIAFQMDHPYDRLHLLLSPDVQKAVKQKFWDESSAPQIPMNDLAALAGGKHGKLQDYPDIEVKPVGVLTAVVYYTKKHGDTDEQGNGSYYIHQMAEITHHYPILACDDLGRLWILGGSYRSPSAGITN